MPDAIHCYIGLGSNLNAPQQQVERALRELAAVPDTRLLAHSSLYRSPPMGPPDQPDYVNAVALLETTLDAHSLLDQLQALEQRHRRVRLQHWGPRTLDLDLLLYADEQIQSLRLQVPHPGMTERNFVLWPLSEISPDLRLPNGRPLATLLTECPIGTLERISL
ncbi:2-amino-4-hydroxy-6-hydroxymethyldihydropteridine diphosphokinase [Marinobacterium rhizophilum]|uniref:2-amino-4-hydroxy-6-hydroxymethyldihydropteridine pyrophosphokinase n=1 Tax=Marinobacterium rhizophilum TaxID=420402 RepID=A0ABY5HFJ4_9GAMM|nr:2-amino-4-hydroxy-6-hydroxymethyldihydropteridine diphosphokinase [Marinobacterium rhizophilum]UTW10899.1 2-amino-4-hydroxy-6-hydroxymethyldihydropteridine diphosphokinase [Marinobacterium rhizophilum]